ncbi:LytTR family DNA-binding domain-containing protein [Azospirillum sp. B4]|uniref:LytR/AlgR family response regulator transcription factor n=1 Tax=Azospirillum sp. B4 TaxID=95605 RepID=UPI0003479E3F|nr:response regulator [Azospirillum sp. B4]
MIRTLIVDDEPLARLRLRNLLAAESGFSLIGEAFHGEMAVALIEAERPDLVFLDIQMPTMDGFEVIAAIGADTMPTTVFVTAYNDFAIKAFEVQALDYLLKPFDDIRFGQVLDRVRKGRRSSGERLTQVLGLIPTPPRLIARSRGVTRVIDLEEVDWISAAGDYAEVHCGHRAWLVNDSLSALATRLPLADFARIHRSAIVRLDRVAEVTTTAHGDGTLILKTGLRMRFSRRYRTSLDSWLRGAT